ncbi:MAG: hypothetical protein ACPGVU_01085 [Limisphaerales bacterium]
MIRLLVFILTSVVAVGASDELDIKIVKERGQERFLVQFELTPDNFSKDIASLRAVRGKRDQNMWRFREGGQFDVLLKRAWFPIQLPESCCNSHLILTMPYSNPKLEGGPEKIAAKKKLFERIEALSEKAEGKLRVTIDLTSYAKVESRDPLKISLRDIQVYFRHRDGEYVDHLKPIERSK